MRTREPDSLKIQAFSSRAPSLRRPTGRGGIPACCRRQRGSVTDSVPERIETLASQLERLATSLSFAAVGLEEPSIRRYPQRRDPATLLVVAIVENVGYRQISSWWRLRVVGSKLAGASAWGAMERKGFATAEDEAT